MKYIIAAVGILILVVLCTVLFRKKLFLFSEVTGHVVLEGKPVVGAVVTQEASWAWKSREFTKTVTTGDNGSFFFPSIFIHDIFGQILPHEPVIKQTITVTYKGITYKAWLHFKRDYAENSEASPLVNFDLTCELTRPVGKVSENHEANGICHFTKE